MMMLFVLSIKHVCRSSPAATFKMMMSMMIQVTIPKTVMKMKLKMRKVRSD